MITLTHLLWASWAFALVMLWRKRREVISTLEGDAVEVADRNWGAFGGLRVHTRPGG